MNRKQFAAVTADAVKNQHRAMNDAIVVYDHEYDKFSWQSSLTPIQIGDQLILNVSQSGWNADDGSQKEWEDFFNLPDFDWAEVVWQIIHFNIEDELTAAIIVRSELTSNFFLRS